MDYPNDLISDSLGLEWQSTRHTRGELEMIEKRYGTSSNAL